MLAKRTSAAIVFMLALSVLAIWKSTAIGQAQISSEGLSMNAVAAFDGRFKYGQWLPIWVEVQNEGIDRLAEVQVRINSRSGGITYAAPVELPQGARKRIPLYVPPNSFSHELEVQLAETSADGNRAVLMAQTVEIEPLANIHYLIGIMAPDRGALSLLAGIEFAGRDRPVAIVDFSPAQLPERVEGLRSFDLLILNDIDTSGLTPGQTNALASWVSGGGRLVIGGGAGAASTIAGLPPSLLPMVPEAIVDVAALEPLGAFAGGSVLAPGPFVAATGATTEGTILAGDEQTPLVVERSLGEGAVNFIALDLAGPPFDGWSRTLDFWLRLLGSDPIYPDWLPSDISMESMTFDQMSYALTMLPSLDLPSVRSLAILLAIYIVLIGPVNYLVLRRLRRLYLAWITIPLLTLLFSAGAFGIGYALRGNDLILNKIAIITTQAAGTANVASYMGLFSPSQQSYEITVDAAGLLSPVTRNADPWNPGGTTGGEIIITQGTPSRLHGLAINQWSMQSFMMESHVENFGTISGDFQLSADGLSGEITNDTAAPLMDMVLVWGNYFQRIGDLAAGETREVALELTTTTGLMQGTSFSWQLYEDEMNANQGRMPRHLELRRTILDSLSQGFRGANSMFAQDSGELQRIYLFAWMDQAPPQVTVEGRQPSQQTTALVYLDFSYALPPGGEFVLPPGTLPGELVEVPTEGGSCGMGNSPSVYIVRGDAVLEYTIPPQFDDIAIDALHLSIQSDGGWMAAPTTALYDWERESWLELDSPELGINILDYETTMRSEEGKIRVRVSTDLNQGGCLYLNMGLRGSNPGGDGV